MAVMVPVVMNPGGIRRNNCAGQHSECDHRQQDIAKHLHDDDLFYSPATQSSERSSTTQLTAPDAVLRQKLRLDPSSSPDRPAPSITGITSTPPAGS